MSSPPQSTKNPELRVVPHTRYEILFHGLTFFSTCLIFLFCITVFIILALPAINVFKHFGVSFFSGTTWDPVTQIFGLLPSLTGTLITTFLALAISVPISFGLTVFFLEYSHVRLVRMTQTLIELLATLPSFVIGMWGLFVLSPFLAEHLQMPFLDIFSDISFLSGPPLGLGYFPASLILSIMITPIMASLMTQIGHLLPPQIRESAYGIGATCFEAYRDILIPQMIPGFFGAIAIGLGRALGETVAVSFVIGNAITLTASTFEPATSITALLASEFAEAQSDIHRHTLLTLAFVLVLSTLFFQWIMRLWSKRIENKWSHR